MTALATVATADDFRPIAAVLPGVSLISVSIPGDPQPKGRAIVARALRGRPPVAGCDIAVEAWFFCAPKPKGHEADLDNLVKLLLDAANRFVWHDDRQVVHVTASVTRGAAEPRTLFRAWTLA